MAFFSGSSPLAIAVLEAVDRPRDGIVRPGQGEGRVGWWSAAAACRFDAAAGQRHGQPGGGRGGQERPPRDPRSAGGSRPPTIPRVGETSSPLTSVSRPRRAARPRFLTESFSYSSTGAGRLQGAPSRYGHRPDTGPVGARYGTAGRGDESPAVDGMASAGEAEASRSKLPRNRSMSSSSCWAEISHCSVLPHGGRKTPPLCWTSQWAWLNRSSSGGTPVVADRFAVGRPRSPWRRRRPRGPPARARRSPSRARHGPVPQPVEALVGRRRGHLRQHGPGGGHGQGVAVEGADHLVVAVGHVRHDLGGTADGGRDDAAADGLGQTDDVGGDPDQTGGAGRSRGEPGLHLVEGQQRAVGVEEVLQRGQVAGVGCDDARRSS